MTSIRYFAIVFLFSTVTRSQTIPDRDAVDGKAFDREPADEAITEVFQKIAAGSSSVKDDEELVSLIEQEIVRTAYKIKTPEGSIEAAARRAQKLVSQLTVAYTTAIYKSKSANHARENFARFQNTVEEIVDFIRNGKFVT